MSEKILLVDDEPATLQGYQRLLRTEFTVDTAVGGAAALIAIEHKGPYAVVVSDMRMPKMDGIELLARVKTLAPDTVRIMLTGNADVESAASAVNEGSIFRFLTKPCDRELLARTLTAALMQYRLLRAEKELLEQTLRGSIHVLTEVLSLANPAAFGRAARLRRYISHIVQRMSLGNPWKFEVAAMMSQLGCIAMDPETIDSVYSGHPLSPERQATYDTHPAIARELLSKIPRLEPIAWIIAHQNCAAPVEGDITDRERADMRLGAEILRVTLSFDELLRRGFSRTEAAHKVSRQFHGFDRRIFDALVEVEPDPSQKEVRALRLEQLTPGMILDQEIRTTAGVLVATKGQEVTSPLILKLKNLRGQGAIENILQVSMPVPSAAAASTS